MHTVIITGIGKGIGRALAEKFLVEGYRVIGTYLSAPPPLEHKALTMLPLDLSSGERIASCIADIERLEKPIDILINNAGVLLDEGETVVRPDLLRRTIEVNVIGTVDFTERIIPAIARGGHVVNISSTAGSMGLASAGYSHFPQHYPAYKIAKAALNMYTVTLAKRLEPRGVVVSSVHPGWVRTDMGGADAELTPAEAAEGIFGVAVSRPQTGGFWYRGEQISW